MKLVPVVTTWEEKKLKKNQANQQRVLENLLLTVGKASVCNFWVYGKWMGIYEIFILT